MDDACRIQTSCNRSPELLTEYLKIRLPLVFAWERTLQAQSALSMFTTVLCHIFMNKRKLRHS